MKDGAVEDDIPVDELEDPGAAGDELPTDAPPAAAPPETPADQPPGTGASSSATSLMPASEAIAGGMFR